MADQRIAAAIRTHYRERLEKGKARVIAKAYAAWQRDKRERVGTLKARLGETVLSIGSGHRMAEKEVAEREEGTDEREAKAKQRSEKESFRFSQAQERIRDAGQQRKGAKDASLQSGRREESRRAPAETVRAGGYEVEAAAGMSQKGRLTMSAGATSKATLRSEKVFSPRSTGRQTRPYRARDFAADRMDWGSDLLESLVSLDRKRRVQKRQTLSSFATLPPQEAGVGEIDGEGGRRLGGGEGIEWQAEEAVEAILRGTRSKMVSPSNEDNTSGSSGVGAAPQILRKSPLETTGVGGEGRKESHRSRSGSRREWGDRMREQGMSGRWRDMKKRVARIERQQQSAGQRKREQEESRAEEADEERQRTGGIRDEEGLDDAARGSMYPALLRRMNWARLGRDGDMEEHDGEEDAEEGQEGVENEGEAAPEVLSATPSSADLEHEVESMRRSLEDVARSLRDKGFDRKLEALMEQRRGLDEAMSSSSLRESARGVDSESPSSSVSVDIGFSAAGVRAENRTSGGTTRAPWKRSESAEAESQTRPLTYLERHGGFEDTSFGKAGTSEDPSPVGADTRALQGARDGVLGARSSGFRERRKGNEEEGKDPLIEKSSRDRLESIWEMSPSKKRAPMAENEGGEGSEDDSSLLEEQDLETDDDGGGGNAAVGEKLPVDRIMRVYQERRQELINRLETRRREGYRLPSTLTPARSTTPSQRPITRVTPGMPPREERSRLLELIKQREARVYRG